MQQRVVRSSGASGCCSRQLIAPCVVAFQAKTATQHRHVVAVPETRTPSRTSHAELAAVRRPQGPARPQAEEVIDVVPEVSDLQVQRVIADVVSTTNYMELRALLNKWPSELEGEAAAYAMLQAANLRGTLEMEALADVDVAQAKSLMEAEDMVMTTLVPALERNIQKYPIGMQCTLVSALAQVHRDSESIFSAVAHECCSLRDATGGMAKAVADHASATAASRPVIIEPKAPGAAAAAAAAAGAAGAGGSREAAQQPPVVDEYGVLGIQLMMISSAYAMAGHYDEPLFELIARQTVQYVGSIGDMTVLVNILGAFMDVQHFDRDLLEQGGLRLADNIASLGPEDAALVLLVYAFFNVKNPGFYEELLQVVATKLQPDTLDTKTAATLYRGIRLLPEPVAIPGAVTALLEKAVANFGPLQLSVMSPNLPNLETLTQIVENEEIEKEVLAEMRMSDIIVRRELHMVLTEVMHLPVKSNVVAMPDGWCLAHLAVEAEGYRVAYQILNDDRTCTNDEERLRGQIESERRCMEAAGWVVVPVTVSAWRKLLEQHMNSDGVADAEGMANDVDRITVEAVERLEARRAAAAAGMQ